MVHQWRFAGYENNFLINDTSYMVKSLNSLSAGGCRLGGPLGQALSAAVENRLLKIDYHKLTEPFRQRTENDETWRGEFWGKIVRSAIAAWYSTGDPRLLKLIQETVNELISSRTSDGCISTSAENSQLGIRTRGTGPNDFLPGAWDIWGRKYALSGLLRYLEMISPSPEIAEICKGMLLHLRRQLKQKGVALTACGRQDGLPACSILGGAVRLRKFIDDPECEMFVREIIASGCAESENIFHSIRDGKLPRDISTAKAYEMLSCFQGLAELQFYEPSDEGIAIILKMYELVRDREIFVTGTGGLRDEWGEYWDDGALRQHRSDAGSLGETCITATWLHYCELILRLTGDSRVYDQMERTFYNAALGAMRPDGTAWVHANPTPLAGSSWKKPAGGQLEQCLGISFDNHDCCLAQGPETLAIASCSAALESGNELYLNSFENAQIRFSPAADSPVTLHLDGDYPLKPECRIAFEMEKALFFTLHIRIPEWGGVLQLNGETVETRAGAYCRLERLWQPDDELLLKFDFTPRKLRLPGTEERFALSSGPWILAQDSRLGDVDVAVDFAAPARPCEMNDFRIAWKFGNVTLVDYASAGNEFHPDNRLCVLFRHPDGGEK